MDLTWWFVGAGFLLIATQLGSVTIARLPLSMAIVYLAVGWAIGPNGFGWLTINPLLQSDSLETLCEVAVLVSLFVTGSSVGSTLRRRHWSAPIRLATVAMVATIALLSAFGYWVLGFSAGAAVLLAAVLAPTDPVLAGDVQVVHQEDRDRLRFGLTGEGGLNDGAAFPFVMLGLGLLGLHDLGSFAWRWWAIDLVWAVFGGLVIGAFCGGALGRWLLSRNREDAALGSSDAFLGLGLVALAYGLAVAAHTYGFLAVFSASVALQWTVSAAATAPSGNAMPPPDAPPARPAASLQRFNEHLASLFEFAVVIMIGAMIATVKMPLIAVAVIAMLFFVIRPVSVWIALRGQSHSTGQKVLASWFGIRGASSLYYGAYAINKGLAGPDADMLLGVTLAVLVASIILHGISVTPLMALYDRRKPKPAAPNVAPERSAR